NLQMESWFSNTKIIYQPKIKTGTPPNEFFLHTQHLTIAHTQHTGIYSVVRAQMGLKSPPKETIKSTLELLKHDDYWNRKPRESATDALGDLKNPSSQVIQALLEAIKDTDDDVRRSAAYALGKLKDPSPQVIQ